MDAVLPFLMGVTWSWLLTENYRASAQARAEASVATALRFHQTLLRLAEKHQFMEKMTGKGSVEATLDFSLNGAPYCAVIRPADEEDA
jgi:hypothetical protein